MTRGRARDELGSEDDLLVFVMVGAGLVEEQRRGAGAQAVARLPHR